MKRDVRIAMLGSGFVADFYLQGLANVNGQEVVVNYSRSSGRAQTFAERWRIAESSTDPEQIIGRDDIDLFIIALPNDEHVPVSLALSAAGRNQVCTKPLGRTRGEARMMLEGARASGAMHGYAETEVFAPAVVRARETIDRGGVGRVLWVRSRESHSGPHSPHFWNVEQTGGGALNDLGCHCVEAAHGSNGVGRQSGARGQDKGRRQRHASAADGERWRGALRTLLDDARRPRSAQ
jgi:predicted dehydrogenase